MGYRSMDAARLLGDVGGKRTKSRPGARSNPWTGVPRDRARYCAGDVAGERGDRAARSKGVARGDHGLDLEGARSRDRVAVRPEADLDRRPIADAASRAGSGAFSRAFEDVSVEIAECQIPRGTCRPCATRSRAQERQRCRARSADRYVYVTRLRDGKSWRVGSTSTKRSPRSRRAPGVGDVAGERGDRAAAA